MTRDEAIKQFDAQRNVAGEPDPVEAFYARVHARAEVDVLSGNPIESAHCRALQVEIAEYRKGKEGAA